LWSPFPLHHGRRRGYGYVGGIHFWWPKITGRLYLSLVAGCRRHVVCRFQSDVFSQLFLATSACAAATTPIRRNFSAHVLSTAGASILALGYLLPMLYLTWSMRHRQSCGQNPWPGHGS